MLKLLLREALLVRPETIAWTLVSALFLGVGKNQWVTPQFEFQFLPKQKDLALVLMIHLMDKQDT